MTCWPIVWCVLTGWNIKTNLFAWWRHNVMMAWILKNTKIMFEYWYSYTVSCYGSPQAGRPQSWSKPGWRLPPRWPREMYMHGPIIDPPAAIPSLVSLSCLFSCLGCNFSWPGLSSSIHIHPCLTLHVPGYIWIGQTYKGNTFFRVKWSRDQVSWSAAASLAPGPSDDLPPGLCVCVCV